MRAMKRLKPARCFYKHDAWCLGSDEYEVTLMARALAQIDIRSNRVAEVATAVDAGMYRVPATALAACLMLEMLH